MDKNLYSREQIIEKFSQNGCFIDITTLDKILKNNDIEAIFENDEGREFFEKPQIDKLIQEHISKNNKNEVKMDDKNLENDYSKLNTSILKEDANLYKMLDNITLDDGSKLLEKVDSTTIEDIIKPDEHAQNIVELEAKGQSVGILEGALNAIKKEKDTPFNNNDVLKEKDIIKPNIITEKDDTLKQKDIKMDEIKLSDEPKIDITEEPTIELEDETKPENEVSEVNEVNTVSEVSEINEVNEPQSQNEQNEQNEQKPKDIVDATNYENVDDVDDMSLLSDSFKAQEKFREYVASEIQNKQYNPSNEFKLDVSERTINMIAKTMAKKIAKYVGQICMQDAKSAAKGSEFEEQNKLLIKKIKNMEEQNKKLRLLLTETNKNLDSYKPFMFNLYIKTKPKNH